jgi:hypothetical protein
MTIVDRFMDWLRRLPDWLIVLALGILAGKWYVEREKDKSAAKSVSGRLQGRGRHNLKLSKQFVGCGKRVKSFR